MPRLYSPKHIIKVLRRNGFESVSQNGSHMKMRSNTYVVIVPVHTGEIPIGTFRSIVRQSGLVKEDFK